MSVEDYKAQANRLGAHLAAKHGVKLKYASLLETLAAMHGAHDWNTLEAQARPTLMAKMAAAFKHKPRLNNWLTVDNVASTTPERSYLLGVAPEYRAYVELEDYFALRNGLIFAPAGHGYQVLAEHLMAQQIVKGGGLLFLENVANKHTPRVLRAVLECMGRPDDLHLVQPGDAVDMASLLKARKIVYVQLPFLSDPAGATQFGTKLLDNLWQAAASEMPHYNYVECTPPFLVMVPSARHFLNESWGPVWAQSRAMGLAIFLQEESLPMLKQASPIAVEMALANTWTKIFFKQPSVDALNAAIECIEAALPIAPEAGEVRRKLVKLYIGDALVAFSGLPLGEFHCCLLDDGKHSQR